MRIIFFLFLFCQCLVTSAQDARSLPELKFSATLKQFISSETKEKRFVEFRNGIQYTPVFIELESASSDHGIFSSLDINVRTVAGAVLTADVPYARLRELAMLPQVKRIELPLLFHRNHDTVMRRLTTVNRVLNGDAPLNSPYKGDNVVIGIIDDGIEFGHLEFRDAAGRTRIHSIWNMEKEGNPPADFDYGTVYSNDSLNSYLGNYNFGSVYTWRNNFGSAGHGTPVASLAAGNTGVAPGATIVGVSLIAFLDTLLRSDRIIDGIAYIYATAQQLQKKCVVNISLGTQWGGPHDGKTLVERAIDYLSQEKSDLLVCTSAGNDGNNWKHWGGFPIHADSSFGFARVHHEGSLYFSIPRVHSSQLSISLTDSRTYDLNNPVIHRDSILYQTPFLNINTLAQSATPFSFNSYLKNGQLAATISFTGSHYNEDYDEVIVHIKEFTSIPNGPLTGHINRFIFKGSGLVHGYFPFLNLHPLYHFGNNPYPNDPTYVSTDNEFSTGIPTNAFTILSSGAYNIRSCYLNERVNQVVNAYEPCRLTYFTSRGPTFDGRIKPDVITPGENVLAARSRWSDYIGHYFEISQDQQMFSGTSASSPITAGIAALLWQRFPHYTRDSIIYRIKATARADSFTGIVPNNKAGWGKVDAFKALTNEDTNLDHACDAKVCRITTPPPPPLPPPVLADFLQVFPNPSPGPIQIRYRSSEKMMVEIFNSAGQKVSVTTLPVTGQVLLYDINLRHLSEGIYYLRATGKEKLLIEKILLVR